MSLLPATTVYSSPEGFWNDARVARLKKLFLDGLSNNQIVIEMGVKSRNAVIGKLHRLGLRREVVGVHSTASRGARMVVRRAQKPKPAEQQQQRLEVLARARPVIAEDPTLESDGITDIAVEAGAMRVPLLSAREDQCRWPAADDGSATVVCGQKIVAGSFCAKHALRGFQRPGAPIRRAI